MVSLGVQARRTVLAMPLSALGPLPWDHCPGTTALGPLPWGCPGSWLHPGLPSHHSSISVP